MYKIEENLKITEFWKSDMGRTLQVTLLFGFIAASWFLISNPTKNYFGISISLFPIVYLGLMIMVISAGIGLISLALSEIPNLNPKHKNKLLKFYDGLYSYGILYLIATVILQVGFWATDLLSDFLANKITKEWWQLILLALSIILLFYLNKKYKFFKKVPKLKKK